MRVAYVVVAALALFVLVTVALPVASAQAVACLVGASVALVLAMAAAGGFFSIPLIRHVCTIAGLWLMVVPALLPRSFSYPTVLSGLAIFWIAGWIDDATAARDELEK